MGYDIYMPKQWSILADKTLLFIKDQSNATFYFILKRQKVRVLSRYQRTSGSFRASKLSQVGVYLSLSSFSSSSCLPEQLCRKAAMTMIRLKVDNLIIIS